MVSGLHSSSEVVLSVARFGHEEVSGGYHAY
jgi:hypothetical protein